ncbi:MAG: Hpt domain-containing protein, partial [Coleofasciculus sp. C2-GNP5-27]
KAEDNGQMAEDSMKAEDNGQMAHDKEDKGDESTLNTSPINWEHLERVTLGKKSAQERLLHAFIEHAEADLKDIQTGITAEDYEQIYAKAHRLRGSSANLGMDAIAELAAQVESHGRSGSLAALKENVVELEHQLTAACDYIRTMNGQS